MIYMLTLYPPPCEGGDKPCVKKYIVPPKNGYENLF